jgi:putative DNA methylase
MAASVPLKKLIEVSIPLEAINIASAREKSIRHGHPSTLHLWWARRPLAACRAVLFAQLVDDPSSWPGRFPTEEQRAAERRRLHKVIERLVRWEASNDEDVLNEARWEIARSVAWGVGEEPPAKRDGAAILQYLQVKAPIVYDPFSGGGSIPLEAQRLGLRAHGSDLNPVAVLIGKAVVEIPPMFAGHPPMNPRAQAELKRGAAWNSKGAQGLAEDVRYYGQWMRDEAEKRIGHLYPKAILPDGSQATVIAWLWARTVRSPDPAGKGAMVPLVSNFMLASKEGKKAWVKLILDSSSRHGYRFEVCTGDLDQVQEEHLKRGTKSGRGSNFVCALTGTPIDGSYIKAEGIAGRIGVRLMAIAAEGHRRRIYVSPTDDHEAIATAIEPSDQKINLPTSTHPQYMGCVPYGLDNFYKMFTARQMEMLTTFANLVLEVREKVLADYSLSHEGGTADIRSLPDGGAGAPAYADAVATYLAFSVSRTADLNNNLCRWEPGSVKELVGHLFSRQNIPIVWDFAEASPFSGSSGDWTKCLSYVAIYLDHSNQTVSGRIETRDAAASGNTLRNVCLSTDPPYYDNIPYADLSDFFYVWLKRSLDKVWPELFRRLSAPKAEELVADLKRHDGRDRAEKFFMKGMERALSNMERIASDSAPLAIFYAFKQADVAADGITSAGWASFLQSVVNSGFAVDGTWPIRTEYTTGLKGTRNALASSIVLVCRKRASDAGVVTRADFIRALKRELPDAIDTIRKAGVGPVDMQQSVIGPGMGMFSRYAKVLEDDDSAMPVKTALSLINRVWEEIENELDTNFDAETQVALAWFATYGFDAKSSGELITLANAKNVPLGVLFGSGVFSDGKGKAGLTAREDLPDVWSPAADKTPTVWECVQHTARVLNAEDGGGEAAARLIAEMGPKAADARALAYRLYEIASQKGWAAEALIYNELAQEWPKLEDMAFTSRAREATTTAQGSLF